MIIDALIYTLSEIISKIASFLLIPLYTRVFSPAEYGIIEILITIYTLSSVFGLLLLDDSLERYFYEIEKKQRKKYISSVLNVVIILSLIIATIIIISSKELSILLFNSDDYTNFVMLCSVIIPLVNINRICKLILRYDNKKYLFLATSLINLFITIIVSIYLILIRGVGITGYLLGIICGNAISLFINVFLIRKYYIFNIDLKIINLLTKYSFPMLPAVFAGIINTYLNRFFILKYLSPDHLGIFTIANKFASMILLLQVGFSRAWYPTLFKIVAEKQGEYREIVKRVYDKVGNLFFICVLIFTIICMFLIKYTIPEEYDGAINIIGILVMGYGISILTRIVGIGYLVAKKTIYSNLVSYICLISNIVFMLIFVNKFGVVAAAYSFLLYQFIQYIISLKITRKLIDIHFNWFKIAIQLIVCLIILNYISLII